MGSQLATIVTAIAGMTITGYAYDVHVGDEMRNHFDIANVPCRVINAIGLASSMTKVQTFGSGHVMTTEWTITDIALIRKAGMGLGLKDIQPDLQGYLAAYHDAVYGTSGLAAAILSRSVVAIGRDVSYQDVMQARAS